VALHLVVGLGNPGRNFDGTRHNVGFAVLEAWARKQKFSFQPDRLGPAEVARHGSLVLLKPQTFMNESGRAVQAWLNWLKWEIGEVLAVVDDVALPLGELRFRPGGSAGGHNGLRSLEETLGSDRYARLRCGIGPLPEGREMERFVLERFRPEERPVYAAMQERAVEALECCQAEGIEVAMNRYNGVSSSGTKENEKEE
jgi:peptidyl-tRNA hydrolase, PTH1 family